jgi:hypothetical protein
MKKTIPQRQNSSEVNEKENTTVKIVPKSMKKKMTHSQNSS